MATVNPSVKTLLWLCFPSWTAIAGNLKRFSFQPLFLFKDVDRLGDLTLEFGLDMAAGRFQPEIGPGQIRDRPIDQACDSEPKPARDLRAQFQKIKIKIK